MWALLLKTDYKPLSFQKSHLNVNLNKNADNLWRFFHQNVIIIFDTHNTTAKVGHEYVPVVIEPLFVHRNHHAIEVDKQLRTQYKPKASINKT